MKNKFFTSFLPLIVVFFFCFSLLGCRNTGFVEKYYDDFFGSSVTAVFKGESVGQINSAWNDACSYLDNLKSKISIDILSSDISKFNYATSGTEIEISKLTYDVLSVSKSAHKNTKGYFDPTVSMSSDLYGFSPRFSSLGYTPLSAYDRVQNEDGGFELPDEKYISAFKTLIDFDKVEVSSVNESFFVKKNCPSAVVDGVSYEQRLDLSGIIKGYAADEVKKIFDENFLKSYYLSFGSSSLYLGENSGKTWDLKVTDPSSSLRSTLCQISLQNQFVSTAGVYEQNYTTQSGVFCHHIIDPFLGKPAETDILSVTVIGGDCATSDALSTALVALDSKSAIDFVHENSQLDYILITQDKIVYSTLEFSFPVDSAYTLKSL